MEVQEGYSPPARVELESGRQSNTPPGSKPATPPTAANDNYNEEEETEPELSATTLHLPTDAMGFEGSWDLYAPPPSQPSGTIENQKQLEGTAPGGVSAGAFVTEVGVAGSSQASSHLSSRSGSPRESSSGGSHEASQAEQEPQADEGTHTSPHLHSSLPIDPILRTISVTSAALLGPVPSNDAGLYSFMNKGASVPKPGAVDEQDPGIVPTVVLVHVKPGSQYQALLYLLKSVSRHFKLDDLLPEIPDEYKNWRYQVVRYATGAWAAGAKGVAHFPAVQSDLVVSDNCSSYHLGSYPAALQPSLI